MVYQNRPPRYLPPDKNQAWRRVEDGVPNPYDQFEYLVMPFGLYNAPSTFQAYINTAMQGIIDDFGIFCHDDILIYSEPKEEHVDHVREVLRRLQRHGLVAKLSKCTFHQREIQFLGVHVGPEGVSMDPSRISTIADLGPRSVARNAVSEKVTVEPPSSSLRELLAATQNGEAFS